MSCYRKGVIAWLGFLLTLIVWLLVTGCILAPTGVDQYKSLTPEQIKALKDLAMDPYQCTTVAGPPPVGRFTFVLMPRLDNKPDIRFGPDCQIR